MNSNSLDHDFLNWMEVGFTHGRVLANGEHHFWKGAVTPKPLAFNAGEA